MGKPTGGKPGRPATSKEAMYAQGYTVKRRVCPKCEHFVDGRGYTADSMRLHPNNPSKWINDQKNMRCGLGNFSVKLTATCNLFQFRKSDEDAS